MIAAPTRVRHFNRFLFSPYMLIKHCKCYAYLHKEMP